LDTVNQVTKILSAIERGDPQAAEQLLPLVYDELRILAAQKLSQESPGQTLDATALVHEAYVRLVGNASPPSFNDRGHFYAAAATAMRHVLIDNARRKLAEKHGGGRQRVELDDIASAEPDEDLIALDEALKKLTAQDAVKGRLVELRYFAGLTGDEAAGVLGISPSTADRHWAYARAWLQAELQGQ
jgi:RNA polymerase sigma factor (TIGR02999 family)